MYCPRCGAVNADDAAVCVSCGTPLAGPTEGASAGTTRTSKAAIASLVLGILSVFTCFLTAIPAIICGIVGLVQVGRSKGRVKGTGLAIAGIVIPGALLPLAMMVLAILLPAFSRTRDIAQRVICDTNLKGLGTAMMVYQMDYDALPTPQMWCDLLIQHADVSPTSFQCPGGPPARCHYALNVNAVGSRAALPPDLVLLFEAAPGWNTVGGPDDLTTAYHQGEGCNIAFVDGHVEFVRTQQLYRLRWTVDENPGEVIQTFPAGPGR